MAAWIKNNLVLVSGIVLPILLVAGFFVLSNAPRMLTDPPQHDFVLIAYRYDHQNPRGYSLAFEVSDGRLRGKAIPHEDAGMYANRQHAGIFRYRAAEGSFDEIVYELPDELENIEETVTFPITEASALELDKRARSPDGYTFEHLGYGGRGGLLGELFGMGRRHESNYVLSKNSTHVNLPNPTPDREYYGNELLFMGWVVEGDSGS